MKNQTFTSLHFIKDTYRHELNEHNIEQKAKKHPIGALPAAKFISLVIFVQRVLLKYISLPYIYKL